MRRFRVGLIPVRLLAPLVLVAVAVPVVLDILKPVTDKLKEDFDKWKNNPSPKPEAETVAESTVTETKASDKPETEKASRKRSGAAPKSVRRVAKVAPPRKPRTPKAAQKPGPSVAEDSSPQSEA